MVSVSYKYFVRTLNYDFVKQIVNSQDRLIKKLTSFTFSYRLVAAQV